MPTTAPLALTDGSRSWSLESRPLTIGRLPECDVVVEGDLVSRHHADLLPTPDGPLLVDRSRRGVAVNGERMRAPWVLAMGDQLQIGSARTVDHRRRTTATSLRSLP